MLETVAESQAATRPASWAKRTVDVVLATLALLAVLPLALLVSVAIVIESPGNPLFSQLRVGLNGMPFRMLKFRTMVRNAESLRGSLANLNEASPPLFKIRHDPRITTVGRFLRASSLDELPQLINVLLGQMSLVGPRPPLPEEVSAYTPVQARRLTVPPGLTGLWQVQGRAGCSFDEYIALDLQYIERWSFWFDLKLIVATVWVVLTGRGAY